MTRRAEFGPLVVGSEDSSVHEDESMDEPEEFGMKAKLYHLFSLTNYSRPPVLAFGLNKLHEAEECQGHSSLDAPSELNLPQKIPSPLSFALLVPQAEG